jgi:hypothetical protein
MEDNPQAPAPEPSEAESRTSSAKEERQPPPGRSTLPWKGILETAAVLIALGLLIVNTMQMSASKRSADAAVSAAKTADESLKITKARIEDSDEAICSVRGDLETQGSIEHLAVSNSGKVSAHGLEVHIEVSRNSLPNIDRLTLFQALDISQDELRIDSPILKDVALSGFGDADWKKIDRLQETVIVRGTIKYENGFGNRQQRSFCQAYIMQPNPPGNTPRSIGVLPDCDRLPGMLPELLKRLQEQQK